MTIEEAEQIIKDLRAENAKARIKNNELANDLANTTAELDKSKETADTLTKTLKTSQEEVEKVKTESKAEIEKVTNAQKDEKRMSAIKVAALKEGLVDEDGLKLADLSKVTLEEDGTVKGLEDTLKGLKESKPYLFGKKPHSSNTDKRPKPGEQDPINAKDLSPEDYEKSKSAMLAGIK